MLYSLYHCISQSRPTPVTNIPQSSVDLHHDILILTHVTVQWRLMEGCSLYIVIQRPTLFLSSVSVLLLILGALSTQAENKGGETVEGWCRMEIWDSLEVVQMISAHIYKPELSDMMSPNCKEGLER